MVEAGFGEFVPISIHFVPTIGEFGKTCALGSLRKDLEVKLEMVGKYGVVGGELHIGEFVLIFGDGSDVRSYALIPLWEI